jgi:hypothetical protein
MICFNAAKEVILKGRKSGITIEGPDGLCDHLPNLSISVGKGMIHNCDGSSNGE